MITTYTSPETPSITNERQYIKWFVQYSDKLTELRNWQDVMRKVTGWKPLSQNILIGA